MMMTIIFGIGVWIHRLIAIMKNNTLTYFHTFDVTHLDDNRINNV